MEYDFQKVEAKWQKKWVDPPTLRSSGGAKRKYYALVEFPYPSGSGLHIGHAFTNTLLDVLARQKRMAGNNVLYPMGWDAFGLPTENYAIKTGIHPAVVTRENTARFKRQNQRLGMSFDWEREIDTTDPRYYKWTQWIFLQLFKHGLAYKAETPVGWCPKCKIILANEEIVAGKCERCGAPAERRRQPQWLLKITAYADRLADELDLVDYPDYVKKAQRDWIGRTEGVTIDYPIVTDVGASPAPTQEFVSCYSTRPETNFGATFIVLAPEFPNLLNLVAKEHQQKVSEYIKGSQQCSDREKSDLSIVKTGVFTGRYALNRLTGKHMPLWVADFVVATAGTGAVVGVPAHDRRDFDFARKYNLEIIPVVRPKNGKTWDYHSGPLTDIDVAEIYNSDFLNTFPPLKARQKVISYLVRKGWGKKAVNYHLRDWIFSRQHYWGEPIPIIHCPKCGMVPLPEDQLPLELPKVEKYQPTDTGESPLAKIKDWVETTCPACGGAAKRETDTMPNWAGSSWYYLAYPIAARIQSGKAAKKEKNIFEQNKKILDYWLPVDLYLGGAEHTTLHLLYSRFWHKFLNDIGVVPGKEPYAARRQHGVILGRDGARMSKTRGNIVNPEEIVEKYGADTLRLYLLFMGPYDATISWDPKGVEGVWRFLQRVWRLVNESKTPTRLDRVTHKTIKKVTEDIEKLKFNTAIAAMMEFVNALYAQDFEFSKTLVLLLAPFAPFMAEELWSEVLKQPYSVHQQEWPKFDPRLVREEKNIVVVQVNGKMRGKIAESRETEEAAKKEPRVARFLAGKTIKKVIYIPGKLVNFVV
ncbi:MAG: leucine--tRNA ligase [Candidatus Shapirobacteria bacterium]